MSVSPPLIDEIRSASRRLVRELGFMGGSFAGTDLAPSSVHALIEIAARPGLSARDLAQLLRLDKSSVSRLLRKLAALGDVAEEADGRDSRVKRLCLTDQGRRRVEAIDRFARSQVSGALAHLPPGRERTVLDGLRLYADALAGAGAGASAPIDIVQGYRPGLIARVTEMHARHYAVAAGFGQRFESLVASGLAAFCDRMDPASSALWLAVRGPDILGSIAIDGGDLQAGQAHLRWFIVEDGARGEGLGRRLLTTALAFADAQGFEETHLWTFEGLSAARRLYEASGFACVEQRPGSQWGSPVLEQRFVRPAPRQGS